MTYTVEKDWITESGLRAVVTLSERGYRCGYVGIGFKHPLYKLNYGDSVNVLPKLPSNTLIGKRGIIPLLSFNAHRIDCYFNVHGGITYSGGHGHPVKSSLRWFGYDCSHYKDNPSPEYLLKHPDDFGWYKGGIHRDLDYCINECESLARQIKAVNGIGSHYKVALNKYFSKRKRGFKRLHKGI